LSDVPVTAAIIEEDGLVLIVKRLPGGRHPGRWEFPGGKMELAEIPEECLAREMDEEMGVRVEVGKMLARVRHSYSDLNVDLMAYSATIKEGALLDRGCESHEWVEPRMLTAYDLLPPDREVAGQVFGVFEWHHDRVNE
jgi:8-oxo-dGTP diphosphatase